MLHAVEFEWDLEKEIQNIRKHRVSFMEAVRLRIRMAFNWSNETFGAGKAVILGRLYFHRPRTHDPVYQARQQDPHYRLRGMEKVSEALP